MDNLIISISYYVAVQKCYWIKSISYEFNCVSPISTKPDDNVEIYWLPIPGAQGYKLSYAPYSFPMNEVTYNNITTLDLGTKTSISTKLELGTVLYVGVQAYNCSGQSDYSNLDMITIPQDSQN